MMQSVSSISINYGYSFTEKHGILVNLTPAGSTDDKYSNLSTLYKWSIPTQKESIKPYLAVGLGVMDWPGNSGSGLGFGADLGGGVDIFVWPELSLQVGMIIQTAATGTRGVDQESVGVSSLNFGVFYHF